MTINLKKVMQIFMIFLVALVTGVSVGKIYVDHIEAIMISDKTVEDVKASEEDVLKLVNSAKGKTVKNCGLKPVEIYLVAEYNLYNAPEFYKIMTGIVENSAVKPQNMKGEKLKKDGKFYYNKLSPSSGFPAPTLCSRVEYEIGAATVDVYATGSISGSSPAKDIKGTFNANAKKTYTLDEYKQMFNTEPTTALSYIISSVSCPDENCSTIKDNGNDTFTFTMKFDATHTMYAGLIYSYEIAFSSGMGQPKWVSLEMEVTIDKDFNFVSINYDEVYKMSSVIGDVTVHDDFTEFMYFTNVPSVADSVGEVIG